MTIDWQAATVPPTGMPYNPTDTSFTNLLYNFLIPLEAPTLTERLTLTPVRNAKGQSDLTIGVGFDLFTGGATVQTQVFEALGFSETAVALIEAAKTPDTSDPNYAEEEIEYGYLQQLIGDIKLGTAAAATDMNNVMQERYETYETNTSYQAFVNSTAIAGVSQHSQFAFASDAEVYSVFQKLWNQYYEQQILKIFPALSGTRFQGSREEEALADLVWNGGSGLLGPGLQNAINSGNRAEAWFQIRYLSNASENDVAAQRRYYDAQTFGLYDDPSAATADEALQAYQMLTANRSLIMDYELRFGTDPYSAAPLTASSEIAGANTKWGLDGTSGQVQTLAQAFDPAATEESNLLDGEYGSVLDIVPNDMGGGDGSGFDVRSVDFYAASTTDPDVDAMVSYAPSAEAATDESANHVLLGSETGDTLVGALGNDVLVAQAGNELLESGLGADTLIANSGNDTVVAQGSSDVMDFVFPSGSSGYDETVETNGSSGLGALYVNGSQIGGGFTPTGEDAWSDPAGNRYTFIADPSNPPSRYSPGAAAPDVGELQILVGGQAGNEIDIWGFNLSQAENSDLGYLGITLPPSIALTAGSTDGVDPPTPDFTAGTTQSYTVSVGAPTLSAETVTVTLTGAPASDFGLVSGTSVIPLNADGTFTVSIPAGQASASFSLVNTGDVGSAASLQLVASIPDPSDPTADTISSAALAQSYVEPAQDPFARPAATTLYDLGTHTTPGGLTYENYDTSGAASEAVDSVAGGSNVIWSQGQPNVSVDGGAGNDTIWVDPGLQNAESTVRSSTGGINVINGDGGQDDILAWNDQESSWNAGIPDAPYSVQIYANSQVDLATAIADANSEPATGQPGSLLLSDAPAATIVGGDGNDLIMNLGSGVLVAGSGDDTLVSGAATGYKTSDWEGTPIEGVTWSTSFQNNQLDVLGGSALFQNDQEASDTPTAGYEGNLDDEGGMLGDAGDTIFGGAGHDVIILSNGANQVHLGTGDSTVLGGMGGDSISGGAGNDCIVGGGGSDYIAASSGNDSIAGRGGNNTIFGGTGTDTIFAGGSDSNWATEEKGNNYVQAGPGNSLIYGSGGSDTLIGGAGSDTIQAGDGSESIVAGSGNTSINGGNGPDTIVAGSGGDTIWGSTESTTIYGGSGTDQISGRGGTDVIYAGDGGTSQAATTITAGSGNTTIYGGDGVDQISGGSGNDVIYAGDGGTSSAATQIEAGSGDTTIYGGTGIDNIVGGSGTDVLYAGDGGDGGSPTYVTAGTGTATLYGGAGVSVLTDNNSGGDVLEAGSGATTLNGSGTDTLIAGSGADLLAGGPDATYVLGSNTGIDQIANDGAEALEFTSSVDPSELSLSAVIDSSGAGGLEIDEGDGSVTVDGALSGADVTSVDFEGSQSMSLAQLIQQEASDGNAAAQTLAGSQGNLIFDVGEADALSGSSGVDTISAWGNDDTLSAGSGGGLILAEGTNDLVTGGVGNDTLDAGAAGTTLAGGTGNEVFEVSDPTDVVQGQADASSNRIDSSVSYALPTNVDVMALRGTANLTATGNGDTANLITGNSGSDTLIAGSGNDTLVSGQGVDTLVGGAGPDTFVINNSADVVEPPSGTGSQDTIDSAVNYVLTAPVARLNLTGSGNLTATDGYGSASITGNAGNDTLIGGSGSDTLVAGTGPDTLEAGSGNNTFVINSANDVIETGSTPGDDTVESSVSYRLGAGLDTLELTGSANLEGQGNSDASNLLAANSGNDTLISGSGHDTLVAGTGMDVLEGWPGTTTYLFNSGFGQAEVEPYSTVGTIAFGAGITPSDLTVGLTTDSSGDPALLIQDGSSEVTVDGGLTGSIGTFQFAGGAQLTLAGLLAAATVLPGSLAEASGSAVLDTSAGASLSGGYGTDAILSTGASDTLAAGTGNQYLLGTGAGDSIAGGFGNDTLVAGGANDTLVAGNGSEELYALGTGDVLAGGMGDDTLYGGAGNDTLVSGAGGTIVYGGNAGDTLVLTQGADVTFYPSSAGGLELIQLPSQMTLADFTSYRGTGGDLILQSLTGDTTAIIKGFYNSSANGKTWMISDGTGAVQLLSSWIGSSSLPPSGYQPEVDALEQAYEASLPGILNQVGEQGGSIAYPGSVFTQSPQNRYHFDGVTSDDVTVQGGALSLGNSEDEQSTSTTLQTGSTTYAETTPVYGEVTIAGSRSFVPDSSLSPLDQSNMQNEIGGSGGISVEQGTDANGDPGYWVTVLPSTQYEQTGTQTTVQTVPIYTTYSQTTQSFTIYNITGDGGNDVIGPPAPLRGSFAPGPFVGTVDTGNGNVSVDLGMDNFYSGGGGSDALDYSAPGPLALGAFIEAGDGNDTIQGSGGPDTIAAGTGFDYIDAGLGSTIYVPLQGASTEDIDILGPFYGNGPLPPSTLVLPNGVTPQDLKYRLYSDAAPTTDQYGDPMMTLQITYGDATVLMDFSSEKPTGLPDYLPNVPSNDINGIDSLQFSNGTVLTRDQMLALAGPATSANTLDPIVTPALTSVSANSIVQGSALFSGSDSSGLPITWYFVSNAGTGGGHFELGGVAQTAGGGFYVSVDQLADLTYVPGTAGTSDSVQISAFDGVVWGSTSSFKVNVTASLYAATGPDQAITGGSSGPDTLVGGYSGDTLVGGSGEDTFQYNAGSGAETISETAPTTATSANVLDLGAGLTPSSLTLSVTGDPALTLSTGESGDSVSLEGFDPLNPLESIRLQSFEFSDGTKLTPLQLLSDGDVTGTSGSITNADGSVTSYDFTPSGERIYYAQNVDVSGQLTASVSLNVDGSQSTSTYAYGADGSYSDMVVSTPAGGAGSTTTTYGYDASGHLVSEQVKNPDGSSAAYTYNDQGQELTGNVTNADGSTADSTFAYNSDGTYSDTVVSTPAGGGGSTTTTYGYDASGHLVSEQVKNPDGSSAAFTYNDQGQELTGNVTNADGSTADSTFTYNADGTYSDTVVSTPAGATSSTTTTYGYDASGHLVSEQVKNPDGSSAAYTYNDQGQELTGNVTNADGSTADSTFAYNSDGTYSDTVVSTLAGGASPTTTTYGYDASGHLVSEQVKNPDGSSAAYTYNDQGQELTGNVTNADGSTADSTFTYNADGTYSDTVVSTPAGATSSSTTTYGYDASGHLVSEQVKNPDGSSAAYTYNDQGRELTGNVTNADGSTADSTFAYNADGTYSDTVIATPAGGGNATATTDDYSSAGSLVNENTYAPSTDGSYTDSWWKADGSHGTYWWNTSTAEYQESWYDSDGSSWTDEYQYAAGGSPTTTGCSFLETYDGSDGSQGTRQYDAGTGAITLGWDSASTGQLSGTTTDSGFIGLQNESELTNTQPDLTFFNPKVSASFNAFLAEH